MTEIGCKKQIVISAEPDQLSEPKIKQKGIMILDVGSGPADGKHIYFNHEDAVHVDIKKGSFHLEVQCDAQFLPFRDDCFNYAHLSHTLEHVNSPFQVIREISSVSRIAIKDLRIQNNNSLKNKPHKNRHKKHDQTPKQNHSNNHKQPIRN